MSIFFQLFPIMPWSKLKHVFLQLTLIVKPFVLILIVVSLSIVTFRFKNVSFCRWRHRKMPFDVSRLQRLRHRSICFKSLLRLVNVLKHVNSGLTLDFYLETQQRYINNSYLGKYYLFYFAYHNLANKISCFF